MTSNKRIFLNVVATYGRSLYALACGLFTSRWALEALGQTDYGIYALTGSLTVFIAFLNTLFASAVARFFAYSIGKAQGTDGEGSAELNRQWFNTALTIHAILPVALILVGYPIGTWAIERWLNVPAERMGEAVWIFRFACVACFTAMANVPFHAMYVAKQRIAELTLYSVAGTTAMTGFLWYMATHPSDWLIPYAAAMALVAILPNIAICARAMAIFPECRIKREYLFNVAQLKEIGRFVTWQIFGNFGYMIRNQGIAVLVNKAFGPVYNASLGISASVSAHSGTLTGAMNGAFTPAITTLAGMGDEKKMLKMTYLSCKFGLLLTLLFAVPMCVEMDFIIPAWLKNPPPLVIPACLLTLAAAALDSSTAGIGIAVTAKGKIAKYYVVLGLMNVAILPLAAIALTFLRKHFAVVFAVVLAVRMAANVTAVLIARENIGVSLKVWLRTIIMPTLAVCAASLAAGWGIRAWLDEGWVRFAVNGAATAGTFAALSYGITCSREERSFIAEKLRGYLGRLTPAHGERAAFRKLLRDWEELRGRREKPAAEKGKYAIVPCDPYHVIGSRGDEAMIQVALERIREENPGAEIGVVSVPGAEKSIFGKIGCRQLPAWSGEDALKRIVGAVGNAERVYLVGGDCLDGYYSAFTSTILFATYDILRSRGVKASLLGFSFNREPKAGVVEALKKLPRDLTLNLRDPVSAKNILAANPGLNVRETADVAFLLKPEKDFPEYGEVAGWCAAMREAGKKILAVNLHPVALKRWTAEERSGWIATVADALNGLPGDVAFLFAPNDDRGEISDLTSLGELKRAMGEGREIYFSGNVHTARRTKAIAGLADMAVSGGMHYSIFSFAQGVPVMGLAYQGKFEGLWERTGMGAKRLVAAEGGMGGLADAMKDFVREADTLRAALRENIASIMERAELNFRE